MSDALVFTVTKEQLESLGRIAPGTLSPISPLRQSAGTTQVPPDPGLAQRLGLADGSGKLSFEAEHALSVLAGARAYVRVYLTETGQLFEQTLFFDPSGGTPVSVTNTGAGLRVEDPAPFPALLEGVKQMMGETVIKSSPEKLSLKPQEALLLAAALDQERRRMLLSVGTMKPVPAEPKSGAQLLRIALGTPLSSQWLTFAVRGIYRDQFDLDDAKAEAVCRALVAQGHLASGTAGFLLTEPMQRLAAMLPIFERILHVEAGRTTRDGQVVFVGFSCLQAGVQDILYVERNPEGLTFEAVSSGAVHQLLYQFVTRPDALEALVAKVEEESAPGADPNQATVVMASGDLAVLRLQVEAGPLKGQTLILGDGSVVGRQAGVSVVLEDARISRRHAEFRRTPQGKWTLSDLGSANGTFVNDQRIKEPTPVGPQDLIKMAESVFKVL